MRAAAFCRSVPLKMTNEEYSTITQSRLGALQSLCKTTNSDCVILWLHNRSRGRGELLLSYAIGFTEKTMSLMRGLSVELSDHWLSMLTERQTIEPDLEISIRIELEDAGIEEQKFNLLPLINSFETDDQQTRLTGVVLCDGNIANLSPALIQAALSLLTERIESLRLKRIRKAAESVQQAIRNDTSPVDQTLEKIGMLLSKELGAGEFKFSNKNTHNSARPAQQRDEGFQFDSNNLANCPCYCPYCGHIRT